MLLRALSHSLAAHRPLRKYIERRKRLAALLHGKHITHELCSTQRILYRLLHRCLHDGRCGFFNLQNALHNILYGAVQHVLPGGTLQERPCRALQGGAVKLPLRILDQAVHGDLCKEFLIFLRHCGQVLRRAQNIFEHRTAELCREPYLRYGFRLRRISLAVHLRERLSREGTK